MTLQQRAIETRENIIQSAARVFSEKGYIGAGMAEIIAGTNMTRGAVYFHFTSKAELARTIVEIHHATWPELLTQAADKKLQGLDAIHYLILSLSEQMEKKPVARAAIRLALESNLIEEDVVSPFADWTEYFGYNLRQAQLLGQMRRDLDPIAHAGVIVGMFLGVQDFATNSANTLNRPTMKRQIKNPVRYSIDAMWQIILEGIAVKS